jgi:hypothetical protein
LLGAAARARIAEHYLLSDTAAAYATTYNEFVD